MEGTSVDDKVGKTEGGQAGPLAAPRADQRPEADRAAMCAAGAVGLRALRSGGKIEEIVEEVRWCSASQS